MRYNLSVYTFSNCRCGYSEGIISGQQTLTMMMVNNVFTRESIHLFETSVMNLYSIYTHLNPVTSSEY